ncbi:MAG: PAS domain S-box protein [Methanobacteriota archaeon]|nr:MAG: PAS domain S-box protein [Euryarchaeota archaeon]
MEDAGDSGDSYSNREFLKYLIQGMAEGVIFIDDRNIVRLCNPVGGAIRGVKGQDIVGNPLLKCHPEKVHERVLAVIEDLREGRKKEVKRTVRLKGGYYEHTYSAVRDDRGRFLGVVAVSRDITEREVLEQHLKERTEKLERSNHLKELFADIIRHDLINPASIISNYAEMALEDAGEGELAQEMRAIKKSADRLIEMIENAGKYSRLEDAQELTFDELDLGEIMSRSIEDFRQQAEDKGITIRHSLQGRYPAQVNPGMADVFSNLISNAIKYSPEKATISIGIDDESGHWLVWVADEAERIPEEDRESIFERFKRVGKGSVKGSGLGLAIVKRIVELHNGEVWVEDASSGGNTFYVRIPKEQEKADNGR